MNDTQLPQLKVLVERAVRPVRASVSRKRKMREELLAHVSAVFDEESARDPSHALERTADRFGAPAEIAAQLQSSIPRSGIADWYFERLIGFPPRGSALRLAVRHALLTCAVFLIALALVTLAIGPWTEWFTLTRLPAFLAPFNFALLMFGASLLGHPMHQALADPAGVRWFRAIVTSAAAWLLVPIATFLWTVPFTGTVATNFFEAASLLWTGWLMPLVLIIVVKMADPEIRHEEEWASLQID